MRIESFPETNKDKNILEILREIIDRASEPMMAFDNKGIVVLINDTACDIIGHSSNECMHHDYRDLLTLTERPAFMESASKRGEVPELFNREEHFFEIYKISKYHIQNEEYITLSAIRNVTTTYQNQEMLEYLKNDAPMGAFKILMDKYFTTIYATDTFYAIHGFTREEYNIERVGRSVNYMPAEDILVASKALFTAYEAGEKTMAFEMRIVRRDGSHGWLLTQCSFVDTVDGPVMYGFVTDNTVVKRQQEEIKELEKICSFTLNQDYEAIYLFDTVKKEYRTVSRKGISRKELLSSGLFKQWHENHRYSLPENEQETSLPKFSLATAQEALNKTDSYKFIFRQMCYDGSTKRALAHFRYYNDERTKIILCVKDVEEEERQKEAVTQLHAAELANRAKSDFLSRMSHDIRTPMNSIIGSIEIAKNYPSTPEGVRESLSNIDAASKFLLSLINDVLDMNKIESGKMHLITGKFDMCELIHSVALLAAGSAGERGVMFNTETSPDLSQYYLGDELRLKQILMNLISNAMKYSSLCNGKVWLKVYPQITEETLAGIHFEVTDNGIGMSEEFMKTRMWNPFEREHDNNNSTSGSGLGLIIVKNLTELMKGTIRVKSAPGQGTLFDICIPLLPVKDQHSPDTPASFSGLRILVIDDDKITRQAAASVFKEFGVCCGCAASGEEGLEMLSSAISCGNPYNTILLDWKMPDMDGLQTATQIYALTNGKVNTIVHSAYDWTVIHDAAKEVGVTAFLRKPLLRDNIYDLLCNLTKQNHKTEKAPEEVSFCGQKILLAEDHDINAQIVKKILEHRNLAVDRAKNGKEAAELFLQSPPYYYDAVLMDIRMPVIDGLEAAKIIRNANRADAARLPIFALSANAFAEDLERSRAAGMQEHLSKPLDVKILFAVLEKYLLQGEKK